MMTCKCKHHSEAMHRKGEATHIKGAEEGTRTIYGHICWTECHPCLPQDHASADSKPDGSDDLLHLLWDTKLAETRAALLFFPVDTGFAEDVPKVSDANQELDDAADNQAHDRRRHEVPN